MRRNYRKAFSGAVISLSKSAFIGLSIPAEAEIIVHFQPVDTLVVPYTYQQIAFLARAGHIVGKSTESTSLLPPHEKNV